ncbi:hypothetical protein CC86DRAFT_396378 [Ophiobolus disseminans]|uniref:Alginate lyase 2 domain-containing protein n=1 Tax=Ophiobolus disseminans TaxID=1469910 RepID=A0A6A6ZR68_9PLEO|nr:hypothetical protein CC86DRAFT_396378 [Ophiobolus disseminans]
MFLSLAIPSVLFFPTGTSAVPLLTPDRTPYSSPFPSPDSSPILFARGPNSCAPGGILDLGVVTLQLPTGSEGKVDTISSARLAGCDGWRSKEYFYTERGALVTKVPGSSNSSGCVTTLNSKHCRTELRDSINRLKVQLAVTEPDDSKSGTVIGQVKVDDEVSKKPVAELFYSNDVMLKLGVSQIPDYELKYQVGKLSIKIGASKEQIMDTGQISSPKSYFKVGNYNQGNSPSEVRFYRMEVQHV